MKIGQRIMRFGIKKLSIGVVSVAVGFAFLAPTGIFANEGSPVVKNESPLVVNATDGPTKLENTDKKQETPLNRGKSGSYPTSSGNKRSP